MPEDELSRFRHQMLQKYETDNFWIHQPYAVADRLHPQATDWVLTALSISKKKPYPYNTLKQAIALLCLSLGLTSQSEILQFMNACLDLNTIKKTFKKKQNELVNDNFSDWVFIREFMDLNPTEQAIKHCFLVRHYKDYISFSTHAYEAFQTVEQALKPELRTRLIHAEYPIQFDLNTCQKQFFNTIRSFVARHFINCKNRRNEWAFNVRNNLNGNPDREKLWYTVSKRSWHEPPTRSELKEMHQFLEKELLTIEEVLQAVSKAQDIVENLVKKHFHDHSNITPAEQQSTIKQLQSLFPDYRNYDVSHAWEVYSEQLFTGEGYRGYCDDTTPLRTVIKEARDTMHQNLSLMSKGKNPIKPVGE